MKNFTLFLLLISGALFSQEISPYYPTKQDNAYRGAEASQLTYYYSDYVQGLLQNFLDYNLMMSLIDTKVDLKNKIYTQVYQDKFSTGKLYVNLYFDKIDANVTNPEIIKSIKITGTRMNVIYFFVKFWDTTIQYEDVKADVERNQLQDKARLYFNTGKPYIVISNTAYHTTKDFEEFYKKLLADNTNLHK